MPSTHFPRLGRRPGGEAVIAARLQAAPGLVGRDAHALAGFIDAEGYFAIRPNNGGRSWQCALSIKVREDDGSLLKQFATRTGLGHLVHVPAHATSRPQTGWTIASKLECVALAELLDEYPLRGRKSLEYGVWSRAVRRWAAGSYECSERLHRELSELAREIRRLRRYVDPPRLVPSIVGTGKEFVAYFGGFFSGDGSLLITSRGPRLVVKLRRDDRALLEQFAGAFEIGSVTDQAAQPGSSPTSAWSVTSRAEMLRTIELLDAAPLLGVKRAHYAAWRPAALEVANASRGGRASCAAVLERAARTLAHARTYRPPPQRADRPADAESVRDTYIQILRLFARGSRGSDLRCTAYERARAAHPSWPKRDTIAKAFGSWHVALVTAGLIPQGNARRMRGPAPR